MTTNRISQKSWRPSSPEDIPKGKIGIVQYCQGRRKNNGAAGQGEPTYTLWPGSVQAAAPEICSHPRLSELRRRILCPCCRLLRCYRSRYPSCLHISLSTTSSLFSQKRKCTRCNKLTARHRMMNRPHLPPNIPQNLLIRLHPLTRRNLLSNNQSRRGSELTGALQARHRDLLVCGRREPAWVDERVETCVCGSEA